MAKGKQAVFEVDTKFLSTKTAHVPLHQHTCECVLTGSFGDICNRTELYFQLAKLCMVGGAGGGRP